jgi:hypothetical protein
LEGPGVVRIHGAMLFCRAWEVFMHRPLRFAIAAFLVSAVAIAQSASALVIDDFEEGDFLVADTVATNNPGPGPETEGEQSGLTPTSAIGGTRHVQVEVQDFLTPPATNANSNPLADASLTTTAGLDSVTLSGPASPDRAFFNFIYDGIPNLINDESGGALGLDLSPFGILHFETALVGTASGSLELTLWDSDPAHIQVSAGQLFNGSSTILLSGITDVDMTDIRAMRIRVRSFRGTGSIGKIEAFIPEPATGALVALGLVAFAARRRAAN